MTQTNNPKNIKQRRKRHSFLYTAHTPTQDDNARKLYFLFYSLHPDDQIETLNNLNLLAEDERDLPIKQRLQRGLVRAAKFGLFHELQKQINDKLKQYPKHLQAAQLKGNNTQIFHKLQHNQISKPIVKPIADTGKVYRRRQPKSVDF